MMKTNKTIKQASKKTNIEDTKKEVETGINTTSMDGIKGKEHIEDAKLEIKIGRNKMRASICLVPPKGGKMLTIKDVLEGLKAKGVNYGIDKKIIKSVIDEKIFNTYVDVAFGLSPVDGKNGYTKYHFDLQRNLKPKLLKNGTADYYNLDLVINVKKGDLLAEITPPTKGIPGKTTTGEVIPAKNGREAKIRIGKNVVVSQDALKMYTEIDGQPILEDGRLSVLPVLEVKGDVGPATGNIDFLGSVIVFGNVKSGFTIKASGDIEINGIVEAAKIEAGGNITVKRGIQGQGKGFLKASKDFKTRYIENAKVEAGENINIDEASMHSHL